MQLSFKAPDDLVLAHPQRFATPGEILFPGGGQFSPEDVQAVPAGKAHAIYVSGKRLKLMALDATFCSISTLPFSTNAAIIRAIIAQFCFLGQVFPWERENPFGKCSFCPFCAIITKTSQGKAESRPAEESRGAGAPGDGKEGLPWIGKPCGQIFCRAIRLLRWISYWRPSFSLAVGCWPNWLPS